MKKRYVFLGVIISITLFLVLFNLITRFEKLSAEKIGKVTVITLPSPPHYKQTVETEEIQKLVAIINESKMSFSGFVLGAGWELRFVLVDNHSNLYIEFTVVGNELIIGGKKYRVSEDVIEQLREYYRTLEGEENLYR